MKLFVSFLILTFNFCSLQAFENKILFKIDNEIITTIDIYHELKFLKTFNPQINELNNDEQLVVSKNSIIRDKIKKTEILNFVEEVKVEDKFIMNLLKGKYSQIEFSSMVNFENYLKENDLNDKLIKEKFAIELIWNDLVFQKYSSKILIDKDQIKKSAKKTKLIVSLEEHSVFGGLGSSISEVLSDLEKSPRLLKIGLEDKYNFSGDYSYILEKNNLTKEAISQTIKKELKL